MAGDGKVAAPDRGWMVQYPGEPGPRGLWINTREEKMMIDNRTHTVAADNCAN